MIDEFTAFCISHCCAKEYRGRDNYCPLAERIRARNGGSIIGWNCNREWEEWRKENSHKNGMEK